MTNLMLLVLAALAISCAPAICAEASDQEHEEDTSRRSPAHTAPVSGGNKGSRAEYAKPPVRTESPTGSASKATSAIEPAPTASDTTAAEPNATPSGNSTSGATTSTNPTASATPQTPTGNVSTSTAAAVGSAPQTADKTATTTALPSEPAPGPYETDRRKVRNWLLEAKKRGVGLNAYMPVWNDMESTVKSGGSDAAVKTKLDLICRNIGDQVKNSSAIQRFRPVRPAGVGEDKDIEVIRVKWVGEKGSDPLFRDKADKWYDRAKGNLNPEERADPQLQRKLYDQRDMIYKEMSERWATERRWAPRLYKNMNQDMGANLNKNPYGQRGYGSPSNVDSHKWYGGTESATPDKNDPR